MSRLDGFVTTDTTPDYGGDDGDNGDDDDGGGDVCDEDDYDNGGCDGIDDDDSDGDIDLVIRELAANQGERNFTLAYADDIAQTATYEAEEITNIWNTVFNKYLLKLNLYKTEFVMIGRGFDNLNTKIS